MYERYEVAIVGGGPAGCLSALLLARKGCTVAVFDHARPDATLIGETLPAVATRILAHADLLERFLEQRHRSSPGIVSAWGSAEPKTTDYLFSPHGNGWHIDRSSFNVLLRERAIETGAKFFAPSTVRMCMRCTTEASWVVRGSSGIELACTVLVDASGRHPGKNLPYPFRITHDRLVTIAGFVETGRNNQATSDYTMIEAVREGWFYSALLPDLRYVVTFTTDADVYAQGRRRSQSYLDDLLAEAPLTSSRANFFPRRATAFSAASTKRAVVTQPNWIALGDAARSYDPLSGLGLLNALKSANDSVAVILEMLDGQAASAEQYETAHHRSFAEYLENRTRYYSIERRWPDSRFWARRSHYAPMEMAS